MLYYVHEGVNGRIMYKTSLISLRIILQVIYIHGIHVIFSWAQIGRSAIFGKEIGVPDREIFSRQKKIKFNVKNCLTMKLMLIIVYYWIKKPISSFFYPY